MRFQIMIAVFLVVQLFISHNALAAGDCDNNGTVSIAEVQSAISMFLGLKTPEACVDLDNNNSVSIAEVQKTINSFLGLGTDSVTITSAKIMYGSTSSFTVTGTNLDNGIVATSSGACTALTEQAGGTATMRSYSCVPSSVGALNITISSAPGGVLLSQASFAVPNPQVNIVSTMGAILVELNPAKAKKTVDNFLQYVNEGFYNNTIIHRVVKGFVVQGGGYGTNLLPKTTHPAIELEPPSVTGLANTQGTVAMARTAALNSATSQFFFNTVNNNPNTTGAYYGTNLDLPAGQGYAVFGSIVQGMPVVQAIEQVSVSNSIPTSMITVTSATQTR
jgi:peptidyl-prolyl cis-trans isomerase A (cyclophilin A)